MRCPWCGSETFKKKPHLEPNEKSRQRYKKAEVEQYQRHCRGCKRR